MAKELKITFTGGDNLGDERSLAVERPILIGRSHSADIQISKKDADVSGRHIEFREDGDGVSAVCLSRNGFLLNGERIAEGQSRLILAGDVLALGKRVRIRIDKIGGSSAAAAADDSETVATGVLTEAPATLATVAVDLVESPTVATRAVTGGDDTFVGGVTEDNGAVGLPLVDGGYDAQTFTGDSDSVTASSAGEGKTQEMHTRVGSMDEILRMKRVLEAQKRQRTRLLVFSFFAFIAVIGTIVFVRWPRMEEYLSLPMAADGKEPDMATRDIIGAGGAVEMTVGYPNDKRAQVDTSANGVIISTYVGKDRDVPFRLQLERVKSASELERSLAESMAAAATVFRSRGCNFIRTDDGAGIESISQLGIRFFEIEEPSSCGMITQRGTGFIRREYVKSEAGNAWHGNLTVFRNGDVCYRLSKEIPEDEWPRGKYLLRDSFLILRREFLLDHWESPGKVALIDGKTDDQLVLAVRDGMDTNRISEWPEISAAIDTLVVRSWNGPDDRRRTARGLLKKFRALQNEYYNRCKFRFSAGQIEGGGAGEAKMRDAYEKCRVAFGWNEHDRRSRLINDPEEWKCQPNQ